MSWINDVKYLCLKYVGSFADGYVTILVLNLSVQGFSGFVCFFLFHLELMIHETSITIYCRRRISGK